MRDPVFCHLVQCRLVTDRHNDSIYSTGMASCCKNRAAVLLFFLVSVPCTRLCRPYRQLLSARKYIVSHLCCEIDDL